MCENKSIEQRIEELTQQIPHYKPQGKMIYFEKDALEAWLRQNPVKTQAQISQEANHYILTHK